MKNYTFLILYCYVSCANVCVLHDSFMDFGNDIVVENWTKSGKSSDIESIAKDVTKKFNLSRTSLNAATRQAFQNIKRHHGEAIARKCIDYLVQQGTITKPRKLQ